MNEPDPKLLDLQSALAEVQRLREENVRLRRILQDHGIQLPVVQSPNGIPVTTSSLPSPHTLVLKAEQRIALFRSLFHGRDDVYAVRWENADGRSGYMPRQIVTGRPIFAQGTRTARRSTARLGSSDR